MGRRAAVLIAAIGIVAAVWWARAPFVASVVVPMHESRIDGVGPVIGDEQVWIRCEIDGTSRYSTEDGGPLFTYLTSTSPTPPPAGPYCDTARSERLPAAAAIAVLGIGLAVLVLASDQGSRRRTIDQQVEAMAADRAAAGSPPPDPADEPTSA